MTVAKLEQERAAFALGCVEAVRGNETLDNGKYKTQLLKLPARLHNNGLGQTAAYLLAQGEKSHEAAIYGWLQSWLGPKQRKIYEVEAPLMKCLLGKAEGLEESEAESLYRQASREARALALWLKRFAEAFLEGEAA